MLISYPSIKATYYMNQLKNSGVKYNSKDLIRLTKKDGKFIWLETGNSKAGLEHIMKHAEEFATKGIPKNKISDFIMYAIKNGKVIGVQGTRPIYEVTYNGTIYRVAISIGSNGFIVGANPR